MKVTIGKKTEKQMASETKAIENAAVNEMNTNEFTEIVEKRGRCQKVFTDGKGKSMAKFYGKPVHRKTAKGFEPIDNTLFETDDDYHTTSGNYNARFFKRHINGRVFDVEKDQCSVGLVSRDVAEHDCITENCGSGDEIISRNGKIVLHGIRDNTDIEYLAESDRIKENIIIKERSEKYEYDFDLALENLTVKASADGKSLEIINKVNGTLWGYIPAPFMYDANGERSDDVYYEIVTEGKDISLKVIADERWINSEKRAFPVVIDPQIVITNYYGYGYETEEYDDGIFEFNTYNLYGGKKLVGHSLFVNAVEGYPQPLFMPEYRECEIVIKPNKIDKLFITNMIEARLLLNVKSGSNTEEIRIGNDIYSKPYNETIIIDITDKLKYDYENLNLFSIRIEPYAYRYSFKTGYAEFEMPVLQIKYKYHNENIEISKMPDKTIYNTGDRFAPRGMEIKVTYENGSNNFINSDKIIVDKFISLNDNNTRIFFFDNDGILCDAYVPITVLPQVLTDDGSNYTNSDISESVELDPTKSECTFSAAGGAQVFVNLEGGESKVKFDDASTEDSPITVDLAHIYYNKKSNTYYSKNDIDKGYGKGTELNINEKLVCYEGGTYNYTDGFGREHSCLNTYYYIDSENKKCNVYGNLVTIESDGKLTYNGYEVFRESCSETGMTFGGELKGSFKNVKYFEQRSDDRKQIEEQIESYKNAFDQYVIAEEVDKNLVEITYKKTLSILYNLKDYINNNESFEDFISYAEDHTYFITETEALNIKSVYSQIRSVNLSKIDYENQKNTEEQKDEKDKDTNLIESLKKQIEFVNLQLDELEEELEFYKNKKAETIDLIEKNYIAYLYLKSQLEELKRSEPVNYASDGNIVRAFNENGDLIALADSYENTVVFERDEDGKVIGLYNGEDKEVSFGYNGSGHLNEITDGRGRKIIYEYSDGRIGKIIYPDGTHIDLTYDSDYNITKIAYSNGEITELTYANGKLIKVKTLKNGTKLDSAEIEYAMDKTTVIMPSGEEIYDYADGKLSGYTEIADGRVVQSEKYSCEYNSDGRKTSMHIERAKADALNSFGINEFNYVKGESVDIVYDDFGQQTTKTESGLDGGDGVTKRITAYTYDNDHHPVYAETKVYGANDELLYTAVMKQDYSVFGKVVREESYIVGEEDTSGVSVTEHYYDDKGRETKSFSYNSLDSGSKFVTEHSYDDIGRETAAYGETGERTAEYEYFDGTRSVRSEKYADGGVLAYGKDISGNVTAITQSTEDGEENSTLTRYDNGRVAEVKSGGTSIGYEYDDKGRTTKIKLNGSDYISCAYTEDIPNADGSDSDKVTATNAKGEVFEKVTDKSGNVQSVTYNGAEQWNATYDKNGNAKRIEDKVSGETLTFTYDKYGRAVSHTAEKDGEQTYTESVTYNEFGKATETTLGNRTYTFSYKNNAEKTLDGVTTGGITFRSKTDLLGRNAGRSIENASSEIACEKIRYRKVGDHATNMPQCVDFKGERITYSYDKLGNITEIKENGELQARYKYDTLGRLVREDNKKLNKTETYTYDGNGNILEKRVYGFTVIAELEGIEHETKTYAYDGDKLISYDGQACVYDAIGNPTTYRGKAVTWEKDRNMTAYDGVAFAYDGRGRRTSKGNITYSYSAGGKLIGQSNGVEFIYDGNGIAGIVYGGSTYFYRKDAQGNITALIDSNGNVVVRYMYDAWGNHTVRGNDGTEIAEATHIGNINPIRYRGYYYDTEIGLYYLQTRYYDPTTGRFVTIDGIAYADPESINGLNLYAYCGNNPVMNVDPDGTAWWEWLLAAIIVAACVVGAVFTGGSTLVGAAFVGAAIGGGLSLASQGINAIITGSSDFNFGQFFLDLGVGALTGAIGASGVSRIGSAFLGGVINGGSSIGSQLLEGKTLSEINLVEVGISVLIGAVVGAFSGAGGANKAQIRKAIDGSKAVKIAQERLAKVGDKIARGLYATARGAKSAYTQVMNRFCNAIFNAAATYSKNAIKKALICFFISTALSKIFF